MAARPELELHRVVVLRDGALVGEHTWAPYEPGDRTLVYSVSKTFAATAVGLAIGEGLLSLEDRIVDLLAGTTPAGQAAETDDRVAGITVHHLLSMSTGHTEDTLEALEELPPQEWVQGFLHLRPQAPVGSVHVYNNGASFLLGELVRRRTGQDLLDYLRPRLLEPLGIDATWDTDALGRCLGWTGMHLDADGLAAMGELLRCDGVWQGRRLLPQGWVARATARHIPTTADKPDWNFGYGYQVWLGREGFRLDGAFGQFAFVVPERQLVVAIQSAQSCTQELVDCVWDHLVEEPPAAPGSTSSTAGAGLSSLPVPPDSGRGTEWTARGLVALDPAMVDPGEEVGPPAELADVRVWRDGGDLRLTATAQGFPVELATVPGGWRRQVMTAAGVEVPVAMAAGADDAGDLHVRLVFTETPHTLRLRLPVDGPAGQAWKVNPLQGPSMAAMRAH